MINTLKEGLNQKRSLWIVLLLILIMILLLIVALFTRAFLAPVVSDITFTSYTVSNCAKVNLIDEGDLIWRDNQVPISDSQGMRTAPYEFNITNTCDANASIGIYIVVAAETEIPDNYIKVSLNEATPALLSTFTAKTFGATYQAQFNTDHDTDNGTYEYGHARILTTVTLPPQTTTYDKNYRFRLWLDKDTPSTYMNQNFFFFIVVADTGVAS